MNVIKTKVLERNRFQFHGIEANSELETTANLKLVQMMAYAPPGSEVNASAQRDGNGYTASIIVSSAFRTFYSSAYGLNLTAAVNRALSKMDDQLYNWRFGRGGGQPSRQTGFGGISHSTMAR